MERFTVTPTGELVISPSAASSQHDFDFYAGKWEIHNRKLNSRLSNCTEWTEFTAYQEMQIIINGLGNTDNFLTEFDGEPFEGRTIRLFNPKTRLWSMYWTDSNTGVLQPPTVGSFDGNVGRFYAKDVIQEQDILVQFKWDKTDVDTPVWSQAFSVDGGSSWEWNWYMYSKRLG